MEAGVRAVRSSAKFALPALVSALSLSVTLVFASSAAVALIGRTERSEWLLLAFAFGCVLPASLFAARHLSRAGRATWLRATVAACGSAFLLALARTVHGVGLDEKGSAAVLLLLALAISAAIVLPLRGASRSVDGPGPLPAGGLAPGFVAAGIAALTLAFTPVGLLTPAVLGLPLLVAAGAVWVFVHVRPAAVSPGSGMALDLLVGAGILLLTVDVTGYASDGPQISSGSGLTVDTVLPYVQAHQDYYLGPVNDVLHGRPLLVESASQYGVGGIYLLAGWFELAPLGYGPLGFFVGLLTAVQYLAAYWILRLAGCGRSVASAAMLVAVAVMVLAAFGSPAFFPNSGGLRFGLPFALILIALLSARRSDSATPLPAAALAVVGLASVWSLETFVYVLAPLLAIAALDAAIRCGSLREGARHAARHVARGAVAVVAAHVLFAVATRLLSGRWPDWGWYLDYFQAYSTGGLSMALGAPWTAAWPLGAVYLASFTGVVSIVATNPVLASQRRVPLLAAAATSAVGVVFLTYFVGRSLDFLLLYIALPAVMLAAIWLALTLQTRAAVWQAKLAAVGFCSWLAAFALVIAWPAASDRWPRTALAHVLPGGRSLGSDLQDLWDSPPMDPRSPAGERLIDNHFPSSGRALVIAEPDLTTEILLRTGRANTLPISYGWHDDLVFDRSLPPVLKAVKALRPGTLMLLQRARGSKRPTVGASALFQTKQLSRLELAALRSIKSRFDLAPVADAGSDLQVVKLVERRRG